MGGSDASGDGRVTLSPTIGEIRTSEGEVDMSDAQDLAGVADGDQVPSGIEPIFQVQLPEGTQTAADEGSK